MKDCDLYLKVFINAQNWGDKISPLLFRWMSGTFPSLIDIKKDSSLLTPKENFLTVGSVLDYSDSNSIIWGSGFIRDQSYFRFAPPRRVCAIRGPLSRSRLLGLGVDCPEVYGDPALLFPKFYKPESLKDKKIGIVPHYIDRDNGWVERMSKNKEVRVIDITGDLFEVVDQICSCEKILSSSLHGIIIADAYGVKSKWIELSDNVWGAGYKFRDYFLSVGRKDTDPKIVDDDTNLSEIIDSFDDYEINIDLDKLLAACPFRKN